MRYVATFAFIGFLGICCVGCPTAENTTNSSSTELELTPPVVDPGTSMPSPETEAQVEEGSTEKEGDSVTE